MQDFKEFGSRMTVLMSCLISRVVMILELQSDRAIMKGDRVSTDFDNKSTAIL